MFCSQCGNTIPSGETKCPVCGGVTTVPGQQPQYASAPGQPPHGAPEERDIIKDAFRILKKCFTTQFCCFEGRMSKREYWTFYVTLLVCNMVFSVVLAIFGLIIFLILMLITSDNRISLMLMRILMQMIGGIVSLAIALPTWGAQVRRLHDTGKSGLFALLNFVCCVGWIVPFVFCFYDGQPEANEFGEVPEE